MDVAIIIIGLIVALAAGGFVLNLMWKQSSGGCLTVMVPVIVIVFIFYIFIGILAPAFAPPKTDEEREASRIDSRVRMREQRDFFIEKMNKESAKGNNDSALIWATKAKDMQDKINGIR